MSKRQRLGKRLGLNSFISKLVHSKLEIGTTGECLDTLKNMTQYLVRTVANNVNIIMARSKTSTVTTKSIECGFRLLLNDLSFCDRAIEFGHKAIDTYDSNKSKKRKSKSRSKNTISGLVFPVTRLERLFMNYCTMSRKSRHFPIFLTATTQYVIENILNDAAQICANDKKQRIKVKHVRCAIGNNPDMEKLFNHTIIGGGVVMSPPSCKTTESSKASSGKSKSSGTSSKSKTKTSKSSSGKSSSVKSTKTSKSRTSKAKKTGKSKRSSK